MENELLNQLRDEAAAYGKSVSEVAELKLVGIISRVLGLFLFIFTLVLCVMALFTFAAVALIDVLANVMPLWAASLVVGSACLILIVIAILCRKQLFIHPFIALLTQQIKTEEELERKTQEAEHQIELQRVRMECQVQNATREFNFYLNLCSRLWTAFKRLLKRE